MELLNSALDPKEKKDRINANIAPGDPQHESPEYNAFGFTLSEERPREIAEEIWPGYRNRILNQVRAAEDVTTAVAHAAESKGLDWAVRMLQTGMNRFGGPQVPLVADGIYGPKTDLALKQSLAENGLSGAETALHKATVLDLVDSAVQSGALTSLLQMITALFGHDLPGGGSSAGKAGGSGAGGGSVAAQLEGTIRKTGAESFVRALSPAQAGAVHVRAYTRSQDGHVVQVSAYDRAAPSAAL